MKKSSLFVALFAICVFFQPARAQRQSVFIAPQATDPEITTNLSVHYVSINRSVTAKNRLFVFFPGTGGTASNQQEINRTAADLGLHAINLT